MLRNEVMCNPSVCNSVLRSVCRGKRSVRPEIFEPGPCRITHHMRFYVASLCRCVRPFLPFAKRHVIQWAAIFYLTQRRNVKCKARSTRPTVNRSLPTPSTSSK